jgi:hypothetical protein
MNDIDYFRLISYWKHFPRPTGSSHVGEDYGFPIVQSTAMLGAALVPGRQIGEKRLHNLS